MDRHRCRPLSARHLADLPQLQRFSADDRARMRAVAAVLPFRVNRDVAGVERAIQHRYRETVLFFPARGQQCHLCCSVCFRWSQFTGTPSLRFAGRGSALLPQYLRDHPEVDGVLVTGGDPLIMRTSALRSLIEPLLELPHVQSIRIGTKALASWPARFIHDPDADALLKLFEAALASGRHLAVMGHCVHPRELSTPQARQALERVRATGAVVRSQGPILRGINDDPDTWAALWREQVRQGVTPDYQLVARPTGGFRAFSVPLRRALDLWRGAVAQVSSLARTARGPVLSTHAGKLQLVGMVDDERALVRLQARDPAQVGETRLVPLPETATWIDTTAKQWTPR